MVNVHATFEHTSSFPEEHNAHDHRKVGSFAGQLFAKNLALVFAGPSNVHSSRFIFFFSRFNCMRLQKPDFVHYQCCQLQRHNCGKCRYCSKPCASIKLHEHARRLFEWAALQEIENTMVTTCICRQWCLANCISTMLQSRAEALHQITSYHGAGAGTLPMLWSTITAVSLAPMPTRNQRETHILHGSLSNSNTNLLRDKATVKCSWLWSKCWYQRAVQTYIILQIEGTQSM